MGQINRTGLHDGASTRFMVGGGSRIDRLAAIQRTGRHIRATMVLDDDIIRPQQLMGDICSARIRFVGLQCYLG